MADRKNKTVLVCEDEPHILESIRYVVNKTGFECLTSATGEETVKLAATHNPDLVILDIALPDISGFDVCKKLRANPNTVTTPIIILTASGQTSNETKAYELGANQYLTKPFSPSALAEILKRMLS